ncbi:glycoside hydrolase family 16 protein [Enterobacter cloacae complex sp. I2]|nr:glycoside hydrolase family 16 protein [Enterobacter cloacae complex sp. I2]
MSMIDPLTPSDIKPQGDLGSLFSDRLKLVFSDEFASEQLDTTKWTAREQSRGSGNSGVQWWYKPENVRKASGNDALAIDVRKIGENTYSGGRIDSQGKFDFVYGAFECRMHIPYTDGHLAAAWLQASGGLPEYDGVTAREGAEIDIIESFSNDDQYAVTIHWGGYGNYHQQSSINVTVPGLRDSWYHTFGVSWTPEKMIFTYDGEIVRTITDPDLITQVKEFPILSNEIIGFAQGNINNAPLDDTCTVYIDYVRVWQEVE